MESNPIPDLTAAVRRRRLDDVRRRLAAWELDSPSQAIFQLRVMGLADELESRFDEGAGGSLAAELLWSLLHLTPALAANLEGGCEPVSERRLPPREMLDARETAGRLLRALLASFEAAGPAAARVSRLLASMFELVERLLDFHQPGNSGCPESGHPEIVSECFEVLGAGVGFLESAAGAGR